jgi:hypothetical protein
MVSEKQKLIKEHHYILIDILKKEKFKKFAEIGVWKSNLTKRILRNTSEIEEYWAVDAWDIDFALSRTEKRRTVEDWFSMYLNCCELMRYFPQLKVIKATSEHASTVFPDSYFDMVYLDANHEYEDVYADIGYWLPKVRDGGLLGGHDYGGHRWAGVKEAVDKFFWEKNIESWETAQVWMKRI